MNIGLIDVDGRARKKKWGATLFPNLALCKIAGWHIEGMAKMSNKFIKV